MRGYSKGFSFIELMVVVIIIAIVAVFSIPSLSRIIIVYKTRSAAETLAQQIYQARQAAITFGRRTRPVEVYLYPASGSRGVGVWFDRNNTQIDPTSPSTPAPANEILYLAQGINVGSSITSGTQCSLSAGTPFLVAAYNSRGELPNTGYTIPTCLTAASSGGTFAVNVTIESRRGSTAITKFNVGISLRGAVSVVGLK